MCSLARYTCRRKWTRGRFRVSASHSQFLWARRSGIGTVQLEHSFWFRTAVQHQQRLIKCFQTRQEYGNGDTDEQRETKKKAAQEAFDFIGQLPGSRQEGEKVGSPNRSTGKSPTSSMSINRLLD